MQELRQSPVDPAFVQDPWPFYDAARAAGPFFHWADYDLICTAHHDVIDAVLRSRALGRETPAELREEAPAHLAPFMAIEAHSMLELEPPRHTRLRALVLRAFTSRAIEGLAPGIAALAEALAADMAAAGPGPVDLLPLFAQRLPVIVICRLLGVPEDMAPQLLAWSHAMVAMYQARRDRAIEEAAAGAAAEFAEFMRGYIAERRRRPADDLITRLIAAEEEGRRLSTDEMVSTCILLLNAGHEATVHTLGNGIRTLIEWRDGGGDPAAALAPGQVANTVEEILRFDPPLHLFTRWVYEPVEIAGTRFARGQKIGALIGAAGRDPAANPDPGRFDPFRARPRHLAFGAGIHFCVGAPLARLELAAALPALFDRLPGLRLAERPRYADLYHFRGLERLMVTV